MRVTRYTVILTVWRSVGLLIIVRLANGQQNQEKSFFGPKINSWHNWLPDPLKIGRLNPLKKAEITFHNHSLVNFGPDDNMPEYYTYGYRFYEPKAGEFKDHKEFRDGGLIHGSLSVSEKSGARTNITYLGLPWAGWQAVVETQNESLWSGTGTTAVPTELSEGTESMQKISTMQMCTEGSDATTSKEDFSTTTPAEASCDVKSEEASSMCTVCSKKLTAEATCVQNSTETPSTKSAVEAPWDRATKASSEQAAEALFEQATTLSMPNSMDSCTNPPSKQSTAPETSKPSKGAYTKQKLQMCRLHPSTRPSLRKSHEDVDQVVQTWQNIQPPVQKPAKSSWLFSAQRNPLDLEPFGMQPSEHRKPLFTTHKGMFQRLNQHFSFSSHWPPHRQLSDANAKPMKLSTRRKSYSVHHAGKTEPERRRHRLRPDEPHMRRQLPNTSE